MTEVESPFTAGGKTLSLVWLTEPSGRYRIVEPYMVYCSPRSERLFHCFQLGGYSAAGELRRLRNTESDAFDSARVVNQRFTPREEYDPFNQEIFPRVILSVPTREGRQRLPDDRERP